MKVKKIFLSTLLIIGIFILAIGFFIGSGSETVIAKGSLVPETDNIKDYNIETKTVTLKDKENREIATIKLLTPLNNIVGLGYQRIAEYEVTGKINVDEDFFGEVLTYDKVRYDNGEIVSLDKVIDLKYKTVEEYVADDYTCSALINGTIGEICEITSSHIEQREVWVDFDEKTKPKKDEKIIIGLYTTTYKDEVGEWIQYFTGVPVEEWAVWTVELNVDITSYYKLGEASGNAIDSLGTNAGSVTGSLYGATGINGDAYSFTTGTTNKIELGMGLGTSNVKFISVWIKSSYSGSNWGRIINKDDGTAGDSEYMLRIQGDDGGLESTWGGNSNTVIWENDLRDGNWHNIVFGVDGSFLKLYVDGIHRGTTTKGSDTSPQQTFIGTGPNGQTTSTFEGIIDEVGFWDRVLTDGGCTVGNTCGGEIQQIYNGGASITWTDVFGVDCKFSGFVKDENGDALVGANVTIWNQFDVTEFYENTTIAGGGWTLDITNSTSTYMAGAYFNNTLIGQLKPYISGTC